MTRRASRFLALLIALAPAARGDEPGVPPDPSRAEIEALIRLVGRDPVSPELVDRVEAIFRPLGTAWRPFGANVETTRRRAADPKFVAGVDKAAREISGKAADARAILALTTRFWDWEVPDEHDFRARFREEWGRESGPRLALSGRVDDAKGRPIAGVIVSSRGCQARTGTDGRYVLKVPRPKLGERFLAYFEAPGKALGRTHFGWTDVVPEADSRDYAMVGAVEFAGRVIDADERPIAGAELQLMLSGDLVRRDGSAPMSRTNGVVLVTRTDARGRYAFADVPPDLPGAPSHFIALRTSHPKHVPYEKPFRDNEALGPGFDVVLEPGCIASGVVVDPDGKPVPETSVTARTAAAGFSELIARTDEEGRFRFENLPAGPLEFIVRPTAFVQAVVEAEATRGKPAELKVAVEPGHYFEGTVIGTDGKPAAGVKVGWLEPISADGRRAVPDHQIRLSTHTKDDGSFRLGPVAPGVRYKITALLDPPRSIATEQVEADGKPVRLELKPDRR